MKRQAMRVDAGDPVGVYFGTTGGEIWASTDEGARGARIAAHLPEIYSVEWRRSERRCGCGSPRPCGRTPRRRT